MRGKRKRAGGVSESISTASLSSTKRRTAVASTLKRFSSNHPCPNNWTG